jgi:hypothetical protein
MRTTLLFLFGLILGFGTLATAQVRLAVTLPKPLPLVERNGLFYQVNSQVPFTGILTVMHKPEAGQAKVVASVTSFKAGKLDGRLKEYYRSGQLLLDIGIAGNKLHGPFKLYYPNGQVNVESNYVAGEASGLVVAYKESGIKFATATFLKGKLNGPAMRCHIDRSFSIFSEEKSCFVADSGQFLADVAVGQWKTGVPGAVFRGKLEQGIPIGEWTLSYGEGPVFANVQCKEGAADPTSVKLMLKKEGNTIEELEESKRKSTRLFSENVNQSIGGRLTEVFKLLKEINFEIIFQKVMSNPGTEDLK